MGTNYYLKKKNLLTDAVDRYDTGLHIGKSSYGWAFSLHVVPGIAESLADWKTLWSCRHFVIVDEYGERVSPKDMLSTVTERGKLSPEHRYSGLKRRLPEIPKDEWDKETHLRRHIPEFNYAVKCNEYRREYNRINWGKGMTSWLGNGADKFR